MEENKNALDEINKGCTMGIEAIDNLMNKIDSTEFKNDLNKTLDEYRQIEDDIQNIYGKYCDKEPHEIGITNKVMTDTMLNEKTLMDDSDSKIAELLMNGVNMGIIEGKRILNNKTLDKEVEKIVNSL